MVWLIYVIFSLEVGSINGGFIDNFKFNKKVDCVEFYLYYKTSIDTYIISQIGEKLPQGTHFRIEDVGCMRQEKGLEI